MKSWEINTIEERIHNKYKYLIMKLKLQQAHYSLVSFYIVASWARDRIKNERKQTTTDINDEIMHDVASCLVISRLNEENANTIPAWN